MQPAHSIVFSFFDHTGDIGVDLEAPGPDLLFADAARALFEVITDPSQAHGEAQPVVQLESEAADLLLHEWLSELLYRFETEGMVPRSVAPLVQEQGGRWTLSATVAGEREAAARLPIKVLVKAITYHQLTAAPSGQGWRGRVIFDI